VVLPQIRAGFVRIPFQCHVRVMPRCRSGPARSHARDACPVARRLFSGSLSGTEARSPCQVHPKHRSEQPSSIATPCNHCTRVCGQVKSKKHRAALVLPVQRP
jgi:hypothetical protein